MGCVSVPISPCLVLGLVLLERGGDWEEKEGGEEENTYYYI